MSKVVVLRNTHDDVVEVIESALEVVRTDPEGYDRVIVVARRLDGDRKSQEIDVWASEMDFHAMLGLLQHAQHAEFHEGDED